MPIREADKRKLELKSLEEQRDYLVAALRDQDWIERLTNNDDFKKFLARVKEAQEKNAEHKSEIVFELEQPRKTRDERAVLNERLMITAATIEATDAIVGWPKEQERRLEEGRKRLPDLEKKIKELGEQNHGG